MSYRSTLIVCSGIVMALGAGCSSSPVSKPVSVEPVTTDVTINSPDTSSVTTTQVVPTSTQEVTASSPPTTHSSSPSTSVTDTTPLAFPGILPAAEVNKKIRIKTTVGDIVIQLDHSQGPKAASNFIYLVKRAFYNGIIFHRVIPGFMIQGGDPTGTGRGGPGYQFENDEVKSEYKDGVVAMANAGPDTNGSQFFIMVADYPLPPSYSVFGKVVSGLDVAHKISNVSRDGLDRPDTEVKMIDVRVE